ncbi:MAG: ferrous iron transport protein B, partial [Gammaproteobacteria bacterium]
GIHFKPASEETLEMDSRFRGNDSAVHRNDSSGMILRLLEGDVLASDIAEPSLLTAVAAERAHIEQTLNEDIDIVLADTRYRFIGNLLTTCTKQPSQFKKTWTHYIDRVVLNRVLGIPFFLLVMYCLFVFAINIGGAFQDFFDISSQTLFVDGLAYGLLHLGAPTWLTALLANGVGKGINTTITFIPVIGALFLFLAFLEDSGYMARAAFVVDRLMRALGLPGKAFVPMIVGFGCNVPAVMAARTLDNKRDRILTIMMSPFMSCGARLAIYAVFCAAFFPHGGQNIVFALYLIGIAMAVFTGFILRKTVLKGESALLVMELPPYHLPRFNTVCLHAWQRLKGFVFRAGKLIVPICVLIGALNALNLDGTMNAGEGSTHSLLSILGQWITPIFAPMGIHPDNWPATVGLVTGVLAKEVVVGTLNTLYTQMGHLAQVAGAENFDLWAGLQAAWQSIATNLAALGDVFGNPVSAAGTPDPVNQGVYGLMYEKFDGQVGAFAYLLFVLLYFPCVSTTAAMLREVHRGWSIFSAFWMSGVAYGVAVAFYQAATFMQHPLSSTSWLVGIVTAFVTTFFGIRWFAGRRGGYEFNRH